MALSHRFASALNMWKTLLRCFPLVWSAAPFEVALLGLLLLVLGAIPAFGIWLTKLIVDSVVSLTAGEGAVLSIIGVISLWGIALLTEAVIGQVKLLFVGNLNEKLTAHINLLLMQKANDLPGLYAFEDAEFYNDLQVLQKQAASRPVNLIIILVGGVQELITLVSMIVLIGTLSWWAPLLLLALAVPQTQKILQLQGASWNALIKRSPESRKMDYLSTLMLMDTVAKEVRLFNLGPYFMDQFRRAFTRLHTTMRAVRTKKTVHALPSIILGVVGQVFVFWWVVTRAMRGDLSAGDVLLFVQALAQVQRNLMDLLQNIGFLYERILFFDKLLHFLKYQSPMPVKHGSALLASGPIQSEIKFDNVSFRYPDGRLALLNVSFSIRAGEKLALVGENGAGKSTIVKLLARLYDPTEGAIYVDGIDLRELDLETWRYRIGIVFQDFGKYNLTVHENINLGNVTRIDDRDMMRRAAELANFAQVAEHLPDGYDTLLGKQFDGTELSGGQWQKLATSRAFVRDAELLILDEPSAALDPLSEYELFNRFTQLTDGKTSIIVTHRLTSVRMVDRIFVLKAGRLIESGTHDELLARDGEYASLYRTQANYYDASREMRSLESVKSEETEAPQR